MLNNIRTKLHPGFGRVIPSQVVWLGFATISYPCYWLRVDQIRSSANNKYILICQSVIKMLKSSRHSTKCTMCVEWWAVVNVADRRCVTSPPCTFIVVPLKGNMRRNMPNIKSLWADSLELIKGHDSHGFPQPLAWEQQQDAFDTPTPISLEQYKLSDASPRGRTSRKQLPERVSGKSKVHRCVLLLQYWFWNS